MNYNEKKALVRCQKQITRDLEVKYIIDSLLEYKILQEQDKNEIFHKVSNTTSQKQAMLFGVDRIVRVHVERHPSVLMIIPCELKLKKWLFPYFTE